ncbi:MAG: CAP domain-containing protein [Lachnospiraceae bacterium]|nr:CAP domain-containing protein [Lachnospiraceae bacterium]
MKKIRAKKRTILAILFVLCAMATLVSCGSKNETTGSGASDSTAVADDIITVLAYDEDGCLVDASDVSEEPEGTTVENLETECLPVTVTDENGEVVTDLDANPETGTVAINETGTEAEEPEGTVTTDAEETDKTEGLSETAAITKKSGNSAATKDSESAATSQKSGGTATTAATTKKSGSTTTTKNTETATTKVTETTTTKKTETTTTAASSAMRTTATEEEKLAIIEGINNYRREQGYTEMPVVLNTFLTEQAQEWADYLAANNICGGSMDRNAMSSLTGDYYWNREYYGEVNLLGKDISYWVTRGEDVGKNGFYECPFVGVGVAVNSAGKTILVVQGIRQITVYDSDGKWVYDENGVGIDYEWFQTDADGNTEFYTESSDFVTLAYKIYATGHFADFIPDLYYDLTYGGDYYKHIPSWMKGSSSWLG